MKLVYWGVDIFEKNQDLNQQTYEAIKSLTAEDNYTIEPVYVMTPDSEAPNGSYNPYHFNNSREAALRTMNRRLEALGVFKNPQIGKPKIIACRHHTITAHAQKLAKYAEANHADWIAVGTHAERGLSRIILGSFAESLMDQSKVPVLTVTPECQVSPMTKNILFPTDLTDEGITFFYQVLHLAKALNASITLLHALASSLIPMESTMVLGGGWVPRPTVLLDSLDEQAQKMAERWIQLGNENNIPVHLVVDRFSEGIAQSILSYAKNNPIHLIAMQKRHPTNLMGLRRSTVLQVERDSPCPVLINRA